MKISGEITRTLILAATLLGAGGLLAFTLYHTKRNQNLREEQRFRKPDSFSAEEVRRIVEKTVENRKAAKEAIQSLSLEYSKKGDSKNGDNLSLKDVCLLLQPLVDIEDPLMKSGLSLMGFDQLLSRYAHEKDISNMLHEIYNVNTNNSFGAGNERIKALGINDIVEIQMEMDSVLEKVLAEIAKDPELRAFGGRILVHAAEVVAGARVLNLYALDTQDIEIAVQLKHAELAKLPSYISVRVALQKRLCNLMDTT